MLGTLNDHTELNPVSSDMPTERTAVVSVVPRATYRIQLHGGFTFKDATALVPYLAELGISHVYCSPYLQAKSGSTHGYDIVDHAKLNPEIGTPDDYSEFVSTLERFGMAQMADVVPNHMSVLGAHNAWWFDVLENGSASEYADFFDIDWLPASPDLTGRVLLPVLGDHYGAVLERGELKLQFEPDAGMFTLRYGEFRFPIDPGEYPIILARAKAALVKSIAPQAYLDEFDSVIASFSALPKRREHVAERLTARRIEKEKCKRSLSSLVERHSIIGELVAEATRSFNGYPEEPGSFDDLHRLLEAQAYRLAYWRVASDEINYRRFFDINELAALRMDHASVFEATHQRIFDLLQKGAISALRIDHPDGLFDPAAYFEALQSHYRRLNSAGSKLEAALDESKPLYVVVEKIIAAFEQLPESWAVHGTTGYRFANLVNGVFVDGAAEKRMTRIYQSFTDVRSSFEEIAIASKRLILRSALSSELSVLSNQLARIARSDRKTRDYTLNSLRQALAEVIASFPVYRTYIAEEISEADRRYIEWAVARARRYSHAADTSIFDFIKAVLLCEVDAEAPSLSQATMRRFARKFQQLTAPVMAKGVEDTAFYIYNRLVSLNDVGGDPAKFGYSVRAFHFASAERAAKWPATMLATSTHDNKRSEDVRARINVLSELASAWRLQLRRWRRMNRTHKRKVEGVLAPSGNDEYFLYQTLIGSFPVGAASESGLADYRERIERYMIKAVREAKVHSSWLNPHVEYEDAILSFVRALLGFERNKFLEDFQAALAPVAWFGMLNSISTTIIKYTSPGVPDCYQGNEFWDFSLADPDNRRVVDYSPRQDALAKLKLAEEDGKQHAVLRDLFATPEDGRAKLYVIWRLLALRRHCPEIFYSGDYFPIDIAGARAAHLISYARRHEDSGVIVVAGRLYAGLGVQPRALPEAELWGNTRIELPFIKPGTTLRNILTGDTCTAYDGGLMIGDLCAKFPGAVLAYGKANSEFR